MPPPPAPAPDAPVPPGPSTPPAPREGRSAFFKLLGEIRDTAWPLLLTGGGFLGFVAFVGGAVTWSRFYAAKLPADQAVDALPQGELIVAGAFALTAFAVLGTLAVIVVYLIDQDGGETRRMLLGLLALASVEAALVLVMAHESEVWEQTLGAGALLAIITCLTVWTIAREPTGQNDKIEFTLRSRVFWTSLLMAIGLAVGVGLIMWEWWVGLAIAAAGLLALGAFRVAGATRGFRWYGVAVFFSVAIFGAIASILNALGEPKVAPAAVIRKADGPKEGLQGLYVTETSDRIYLGSVATTKCGGTKLRHDSGRLFWVQKGDVEAVVFGPRQEADTASIRAPEMLADLITTRVANDTNQGSSITTAATTASNTVAEPKPTEEQSRRQKSSKKSPGKQSGTSARKKNGSDQNAQQKVSKPIPRPIEAVPAVREEPTVKLKTAEARPGERLEIEGKGFGPRGKVTVSGKPAEVESWNEKRIVVLVPKGAKTGRVVVGCANRGNRPLLRILEPPIPVAVPTPVRGRVGTFRLDGRSSRDPDGRIVSYLWTSGNKTVGSRKAVRFRAPTEDQTVTVKLTVRDNDGLEASTSVRVGTKVSTLTFPSNVLFCFDCQRLSTDGVMVIAHARSAIRGATTVTVDGHTDSVGTRAYNQNLGRDRAIAVREELLRGLKRPRPRITARSFGETKPRTSNRTVRGRDQNRRVELRIKRREVTSVWK